MQSKTAIYLSVCVCGGGGVVISSIFWKKLGRYTTIPLKHRFYILFYNAFYTFYSIYFFKWYIDINIFDIDISIFHPIPISFDIFFRSLLPLQEYDRTEVCSTIRYLTTVNMSPKEIFNETIQVYDEGCMNIQNMCKWRKEYLAGWSQLYDKSHSRRPSDNFTFENIQQIHYLWGEDWRTSISEVCYRLQPPDCDRILVCGMVKNVLGLQKLATK